MRFYDVLQFVFSAAVKDVNDCIDFDCFGSSFSAVTAAWATKGYWMQAELIHFLGDTGLGIYASLIYIIAVGAGLIGYMLGNPPRNYLWYFFGPALFNILVFTTIPAGGVMWQVGIDGDGERVGGAQAEVWKLAEVGLLNMSIKDRLGITVSSDTRPSKKVEVAHLFAWVDDLVSDFCQSIIALVGPAALVDNAGGGKTNINSIAVNVDVTPSQFQKMSLIKWGLLQNITGASIKSPVMAKALGVFLGSECGDILTEQLEQSKFTQAARTRTGELPNSVFKNTGAGAAPNYSQLKDAMDSMWISMPDPLKALYMDDGVAAGENSLVNFSTATKEGNRLVKGQLPEKDSISCSQYLSLLVEAMRWESGNAFTQLVEQAPDKVPANGALYSLYYGWGIRKAGSDTPVPVEELKHFTVDLMLVHIVKNLFEYTPVSPDQRYSPSEEVQSYIQLQQKTTSSTTKFAEVYSWALMMPYIQGLVLYFLAIAYPIVCVAMIMPGLHKLPLTWIKYWIWIKLWDVGFALVEAIERSVWAMMSNGKRSQKAFESVIAMKQWSSAIDWKCAGATDEAGIRGCPRAWTIQHQSGGGPSLNDAFNAYIMPVFDYALKLSVNLELDLANSYYIYIMAALYFAVPAIAGQLVGSAGGIASGALDKMTDVKGAASAGYTSDMNQRMAGFAQSYGQETSFKNQRSAGGDGRSGQAGLGTRAIQSGNGALAEGQVAGEYDAMNAALGTGQAMTDKRHQRVGAQISRDQQVVGAAAAGLNAFGSGMGIMTPGTATAGGTSAAPGLTGGAPGGGATGAPGGGGGGGVGGGRAGRGGGLWAQAKAKGPGAVFAGGAIAKTDFDVDAANATLENTHASLDAAAGYEAQRGLNSASGATARMNQGRMQADSGRLMRGSNFAGSEGKWNAMNDLNTKMGGKLGVIGLNFSPYGAGGRSDDTEGGAYAGRMNHMQQTGTDANGKATFGMSNMGSQIQFAGQGGPLATRIGDFSSGQLKNQVNDSIGQYQGHGTNTNHVISTNPFNAVDKGKWSGTSASLPNVPSTPPAPAAARANQPNQGAWTGAATSPTPKALPTK